MKVLVISHMYPSRFDKVKGIFVHEQVKALKEKGVEIRVVSPVPWAPFPLSKMSRKWESYRAIPLATIWEEVKVWHPRYLAFPRSMFFASAGLRMYQGIKNVVAEIYQEFPFDLIHAHVALPDGYAGMMLSRKYQKPLVITIHGQDLNYTIFQSKKWRNAVQESLEAARKTIVVSRKLQRVAAKYLTSALPMVVINNGIDPGEIVLRSTFLPQEWHERRIILSVSHLIQTKGVDLNIRAIKVLLKKYPNLYYVVVGDGPLRKPLETLTHQLNLEKYIKFVGQQPHSKVMEYMANCTVFSLPSWREGFGIVYLEAMAHGKPVVACRGEGIEDVIEHGNTGMLAKPQDVDSLVDALDFLLSHPSKAEAMGKRARKLVLENYTWEKNAEKTIEVYEEVLNGA